MSKRNPILEQWEQLQAASEKPLEEYIDEARAEYAGYVFARLILYVGLIGGYIVLPIFLILWATGVM